MDKFIVGDIGDFSRVPVQVSEDVLRTTNEATPPLGHGDKVYFVHLKFFNFNDLVDRNIIKIDIELQEAFNCQDKSERICEIICLINRWVDVNGVCAGLRESCANITAKDFALLKTGATMHEANKGNDSYLNLYRAIVFKFCTQAALRRHIPAVEHHIQLGPSRFQLPCTCTKEIKNKAQMFTQEDPAIKILSFTEKCCSSWFCDSINFITRGFTNKSHDGPCRLIRRLNMLSNVRKTLCLSDSTAVPDQVHHVRAHAATAHAERPVPMSTEAPAAKRAKPQTLWDAARAHAAKRGVDMDRRAIPLE
jgi:hypothetical protein